MELVIHDSRVLLRNLVLRESDYKAVTRLHWGARSRVANLGLLGEYRGTSLIRKHLPLGPYSRPMPSGL